MFPKVWSQSLKLPQNPGTCQKCILSPSPDLLCEPLPGLSMFSQVPKVTLMYLKFENH